MLNNLIKCTIIVVTVVSLGESSSSYQNALEANENAATTSIRFRHQLLTDVFLLKGNLITLQTHLNELSEGLIAQTAVIRNLQLQFSLSPDAIDECEMTEFFYDIDSKLIKIKQKIQQIVNDNDDEHMDKFDNILHNVRKTTLECSMDGNDLFVNFQTNITAKLGAFEKQMARLTVLEQRFIDSEQQDQRLTNANDALTKLLEEIRSKLNGQEEKLDKLETYLPVIVNVTQSIAMLKENEDAMCKTRKCISKKLLELTNGQDDVQSL